MCLMETVMFNVIWACDLCGHVVHHHSNYDNIIRTDEFKVSRMIWEVPLDVDGCVEKVLVCDDCKRKILPDPKSPEATSRPAD